MDPFLTGVIAGFGIAVPVGAIAILIVQVGIRCGFRCAASAGAGAATADLAYAVLAIAGGAALAARVDAAGPGFRLASAGLLATIAIVGLARAPRQRAPVDAELPGRREYLATYGKFLGLTVVNPLTVVYFAAIVVGLELADDLTAAEGARFVVGAFAASLSWQTLLAGVGAVAHRRLPGGVATGAAIVGNVIVLGIAVLVAVG